MLSSLYAYLAERSFGGLLRDALDVAVVYYASYRGLLVLRGTRAMQIGAGLVILLALFAAARALELVTVTSILGTLFSSLLLIIVVVF
jgi:DNA integrity scanning protein DisA with diadenylate cyclase activity